MTKVAEKPNDAEQKYPLRKCGVVSVCVIPRPVCTRGVGIREWRMMNDELWELLDAIGESRTRRTGCHERGPG